MVTVLSATRFCFFMVLFQDSFSDSSLSTIRSLVLTFPDLVQALDCSFRHHDLSIYSWNVRHTSLGLYCYLYSSTQLYTRCSGRLVRHRCELPQCETPRIRYLGYLSLPRYPIAEPNSKISRHLRLVHRRSCYRRLLPTHLDRATIVHKNTLTDRLLLWSSATKQRAVLGMYLNTQRHHEHQSWMRTHSLASSRLR